MESSLFYNNRELVKQQHEETTDTPLLAAILSNVFLFLLIFGLSATVHMKQLSHQFRSNQWALLTGIGMQFVVLPGVGSLICIAFKHYISQPMAVALLVVTSSPGGSYSNWWCSLFNAGE